MKKQDDQQLRKALEPFAIIGSMLMGHEFKELYRIGGVRITIQDLKLAQKVYEDTKNEKDKS